MRARRRKAQGGFTLVELMVSLTLFSFAIAGVLAVAVSMAQGYREQRQVVQTESTARSALDFITDAVRMASPAVTNPDVTMPTVVGDPNITVGDIEDTEHSTNCTATGGQHRGAIRFFDGGSAGSDTLEIVYASGAAVTSVGFSGGVTQWQTNDTTLYLADASNLAVGDRVLVTDGAKGHVARISGLVGNTATVAIGTCTPSGTYTYNQGDLVIRVFRAKFYIQTTPFDGVAPVLLMDPDGDGQAPPEPLADYVEDFQVAVGVDEGDETGAPTPNNSIDEVLPLTEWGFSSATAPTTFTNGRDLRALRITLVVQSPMQMQQTGATFFRPAVENRAAGPGDRYRRRILSATVDVRNLKGSP